MEFDEMMATSAGKKRKEKIAKNDVAEAEKQGERENDCLALLRLLTYGQACFTLKLACVINL